ncbi:hypothetical protein HELRODRAFT_165811 [Helobdella robusta]|uniref:Uncharacterized protein n=1 Tax=Helobdella robusta TaxID=6412 RepID=T1EXB1_HELRO|nr:hypothetical protein HELRODRAFT_165811 [Helobdella robusta]ESN91743.1 hypothetical protein HELRODRAFT_165811 [Helobdella robusta]
MMNQDRVEKCGNQIIHIRGDSDTKLMEMFNVLENKKEMPPGYISMKDPKRRLPSSFFDPNPVRTKAVADDKRQSQPQIQTTLKNPCNLSNQSISHTRANSAPETRFLNAMNCGGESGAMMSIKQESAATTDINNPNILDFCLTESTTTYFMEPSSKIVYYYLILLTLETINEENLARLRLLALNQEKQQELFRQQQQLQLKQSNLKQQHSNMNIANNRNFSNNKAYQGMSSLLMQPQQPQQQQQQQQQIQHQTAQSQQQQQHMHHHQQQQQLKREQLIMIELQKLKMESERLQKEQMKLSQQELMLNNMLRQSNAQPGDNMNINYCNNAIAAEGGGGDVAGMIGGGAGGVVGVASGMVLPNESVVTSQMLDHYRQNSGDSGFVDLDIMELSLMQTSSSQVCSYFSSHDIKLRSIYV